MSDHALLALIGGCFGLLQCALLVVGILQVREGRQEARAYDKERRRDTRRLARTLMMTMMLSQRTN